MSHLVGGKAKWTGRGYRSHCKNCGQPVYQDQPAVWQGRTPLGLVHEVCP